MLDKHSLIYIFKARSV